MDKRKNYRTPGLFLGVIVCAALILWGCRSKTGVYLQDAKTGTVYTTELAAGGDDAAVNAMETQEQEDNQDAGAKQQAEATEELCVYVCGAVKASGVYMLPQGSRVVDAVEAAGGISKDACTDYWNLAEPVSDGQMIDVPTRQEAADLRAEGAVPGGNGSGDGRQSKEASVSGDAQEPGVSADGKININTASKEQLMQIPGVGATRAENIISYRESSGGFSGIEDIMQVNGIKEGLFAKMKDYISTSS